MSFLHYILVLLSVCYREVQVTGLETCFLWFLIMHLDALLDGSTVCSMHH